MSEQQFLKEENLFIIKEIESFPTATQRYLSKKLGISLGKIHYLLKMLINKGFIKAKSFSDNPGKLQKISYALTKEGLQEKMRLTQHFLHRKEEEYNRLKQDWEELSACHNL